MNAREGELIAQFSLSHPADNEDFPLTPPPVGGEIKSMTVWNPLTGASGFQAELTKVYTGPQTKDDCKKGGWEQYGFKNQGQCVRYIETGTDSRG